MIVLPRRPMMHGAHPLAINGSPTGVRVTCPPRTSLAFSAHSLAGVCGSAPEEMGRKQEMRREQDDGALEVQVFRVKFELDDRGFESKAKSRFSPILTSNAAFYMDGYGGVRDMTR
ncbi:hypothetical protein B0H13DRAFT_1871761 [Mycena leptocephala]|nr:hypothetical protein B0H13DRAFT_1871761 [Mycena leptocephala]